MERIVAAAIVFEGINCVLPPPARHHTILHAIAHLRPDVIIGPDEQGFVTDTGRWVDRFEAKRIAIEAQQYLVPEDIDLRDRLYSEELW